jgi:hypothetical protein
MLEEVLRSLQGNLSESAQKKLQDFLLQRIHPQQGGAGGG